MKRMMLFLAVFGVVFAFGTSAYSAEVTSTLDVSANVLAVCTVSTTPIDFGDYDESNQSFAQGSVDVTCSQGTFYNIALDYGSNYIPMLRRMTDGSSNYLLYNIFQDQSGTTVWGDSDFDNTFAQGPSLSDTANGLLQEHTTYGWVPDSQVVPSGPYSDVVNVTVYY